MTMVSLDYALTPFQDKYDNSWKQLHGYINGVKSMMPFANITHKNRGLAIRSFIPDPVKCRVKLPKLQAKGSGTVSTTWS